jgi:hypothetical protein
MGRVLMDEVVATDYGQLDLWFSDDVDDDGDIQATFTGQLDGVAGAAVPGRIYLNLGRRSGGPSVRMEAHDGVISCDGNWEDIVEVSTVVGEQGDCGWSRWAGESGGQFVLPPGPHRVRACAHGRTPVWVARTPGTGTRRGARTDRDLDSGCDVDAPLRSRRPPHISRCSRNCR